MRALVCSEYGGLDSLSIEEVPEPQPGPGEVRIAVRAAGVNFPDLLAIRGQYQIRSEPPFVPGMELSGVVDAIGDGVDSLQEGDEVILVNRNGGFAEKCLGPAARCLPKPASLSFEAAASLIVTYATSWHAFRQCCPLSEGQTVLVLGAAGGVGSSAVELAHQLGARVIAAASSDEKLAFCRELGASDTINYSTTSLRDAVKAVTDGKGVDVVYDPVGGELAMQAYRSLAWQGRYIVIGFAAGDIPSLPLNIALLKEASIMGCYWGGWTENHLTESLQNTSELLQMAAEGRIDPRVSGTYPLEDFADAFGAISDRRSRGKVVLTP